MPLCNMGLRKWHMKGISCFFVYANCACVTEWSGVSRLYFSTLIFDPWRVVGPLHFKITYIRLNLDLICTNPVEPSPGQRDEFCLPSDAFLHLL